MSGLLDGAYRRQLQECFDEARSQESPWESNRDLRVEHFMGQYPAVHPWAIGPFIQDPAMTLRLAGDWSDPTGIGWVGQCVWNPTMVEYQGRLHLFYRFGPRKESLSSRIGLAEWDGEQWKDYAGNPVIYSTMANEVLSCDDPKIYRVGDLFYLFYNGVYPVPQTVAARPEGESSRNSLAVDINLAISRDLRHWERMGSVVPTDVSRYWAKAAVIPRSAQGEAVPIRGQFVMLISEGCGNQQHIGTSTDMVHWRFTPKTFLALPKDWGVLYEVACAVLLDDDPPGPRLLLDFFYQGQDGRLAAGQALYDPFDLDCPLAMTRGGTLAWGGLIQYRGTWLFAQGWDALHGRRELFMYRAPIR